ncbi:Holliday junction branch migration protein RuvA [Brooklawnia sp.]|uniref:Holliday junction branch migration protein RuvA n=1 Tax=Brooklawnia sp. TaxID=2699740 RepID=UPI00311FA904
MISQLRGTAVALGPNWAVIDVSGVGFRVSCTPGTAAGLRPGAECTVATTLIVRQDALTLFGFTDAHERQAFEMLQLASGVGPKLALAAISVLSPAEVVSAIQSDSVAVLMKVPGIGRKGAEKIIVELRDRVGALAAQLDTSDHVGVPDGEPWREQVSSGLQGLGWSSKDADAAVEKIAPLVVDDPQISLGRLMKAALQSLARA